MNNKKETWEIDVLIILLVILALVISFSFHILGPKFNIINTCLKETATKLCSERNMALRIHDTYPHLEYYFWCRGLDYRKDKFISKFTKQELENCGVKKW